MKDVADHRNYCINCQCVYNTIGIIQDWYVQKICFSLKDLGALLANFYLQNDHFGTRILKINFNLGLITEDSSPISSRGSQPPKQEDHLQVVTIT